MATRGYIARIERDGSGELIYLGHSSQPTDAGKLLLEHYSDAEAITELLQHGSVCHLNETTMESIFYHRDHNHRWDNCHPVTLHDGTEGLFGKPYQPGPEWLYAWTPDGWLAAAVDRKVPKNYVDQIGRMGVDQLEDWFQHNPDPQWIAWRAAAVDNQRPVPLSSLIAGIRREKRQIALLVSCHRLARVRDERLDIARCQKSVQRHSDRLCQRRRREVTQA